MTIVYHTTIKYDLVVLEECVLVPGTHMLMKHYDSSMVNAEIKFGAPGLEGLESEEAGRSWVARWKKLAISHVCLKM